MQNKKILFIVNVDWFFISHRLPLALAAQSMGYEVHVATTLTDKSISLKKYNFIVHNIRINRKGSGFIGLIATFLKFISLMRKLRPTIVHLVTIKPVLFGSIAARFLRIHAVVVAISGLGYLFVDDGYLVKIRRSLVSLAYRFGFKNKNIKIIYQNNYDMSILKRITGIEDSKTIIIRGSGVDLTQYIYKPISSRHLNVLFASRLLFDKGILEFVEAARILASMFHESIPNVRFVIVGSPDPGNPNSVSSSDLKAWVDEGVVEYWGYRDDMPSVISSASIVVLPSYYGEGLPKVLVEAAACGRAVVTTDHPGCRDAIVPGVTGVLVPVRDARALADAIQVLLEHPDNCHAMGRAGRELAEQSFDLKQVIASHLEIYEELLSKVEQ